MLFDHIDLRVSDIAGVRPLYDALLPAMGCSHLDEGDDFINYYLAGEDRTKPFFGLMQERSHQPNGTRIAFRAGSRSDVDRLGAIAAENGAREYDPPGDYDPDSPWYYATFFEDADGNKLEICYREHRR